MQNKLGHGITLEYDEIPGRSLSLHEIVGKTIESTVYCLVNGEYGSELCIALIFTDKTKHGFVVPE